jgi:hypothetical protein
MPSIKTPRFSVRLLAGSSNVEVSASIDAAFTPFDKALIKLGLTFRMKCKLWGADSGLNGADDELFTFTNQLVTKDGTVKFKEIIPSSTLDEDWNSDDDIFARFTLQSREAIIPFSVSLNSAQIHGDF